MLPTLFKSRHRLLLFSRQDICEHKVLSKYTKKFLQVLSDQRENKMALHGDCILTDCPTYTWVNPEEYKGYN
jgi:hypothetical protein